LSNNFVSLHNLCYAKFANPAFHRDFRVWRCAGQRALTGRAYQRAMPNVYYRDMTRTLARVAALMAIICSILGGVVMACSSDAKPAVTASPGAGADLPDTGSEAASPTASDAGPQTGCEPLGSDGCLCGGWSGDHYPCTKDSLGGSVCRNYDCFCSCRRYNCAQSSGGCDCQSTPLAPTDTRVGTCRPNDGGVDAGVCCFRQISDSCSCDFTGTKCFGNALRVPSCDLADLPDAFAPLLPPHADVGYGHLVSSCENLIGTYGDSGACRQPDDNQNCAKNGKGCGLPIECAPGIRCCSPICDLASGKCVLKCTN